MKLTGGNSGGACEASFWVICGEELVVEISPRRLILSNIRSPEVEGVRGEVRWSLEIPVWSGERW